MVLYSAREKGENISLYAEDLTKKMIKLKVTSEYYYILALESEKKVLENEYEKAKLQSETVYIQREEVIMNTIISAVNSYNNVQKSIEDKELADMNYNVAKQKFNQKKLENEVGNITDTDLLKEMAELEKPISLKEKADYKYNVSVEALKMLIEK